MLLTLFSYSPDKIGKLTEQMVGYNLTTKQTPPEGVLVKKVKKYNFLIFYSTETKFRTSHSEAVSAVLISIAILLQLG